MEFFCHQKKKLNGLLFADQLQYIPAHSAGFQVLVEGRIGHRGWFRHFVPTYLPMLVYNLPMVRAMWPSTKTTALVLRWECKHPWQGTYLTIFIWPNPTRKWECKQSMPSHLQLTTFYTDLPRVQVIYEQGTPFDNFLAIKISEKGSNKISLKNDIEIHCSFFL